MRIYNGRQGSPKVNLLTATSLLQSVLQGMFRMPHQSTQKNNKAQEQIGTPVVCDCVPYNIPKSSAIWGTGIPASVVMGSVSRSLTKSGADKVNFCKRKAFEFYSCTGVYVQGKEPFFLQPFTAT